MGLLELDLPLSLGPRFAHGEELTFEVGREPAVDGDFVRVLCVLLHDLPLKRNSSVRLHRLQAQ